jgi:hypothetical protein
VVFLSYRSSNRLCLKSLIRYWLLAKYLKATCTNYYEVTAVASAEEVRGFGGLLFLSALRKKLDSSKGNHQDQN